MSPSVAEIEKGVGPLRKGDVLADNDPRNALHEVVVPHVPPGFVDWSGIKSEYQSIITRWLTKVGPINRLDATSIEDNVWSEVILYEDRTDKTIPLRWLRKKLRNLKRKQQTPDTSPRY